MSKKSINYIARDFDAVRDELEKFSYQYYPELAADFNDSSIGAWIMDIAAAVGDELAYYTDRNYQETTLDSANMKSTVLNMARNSGLRIPGAKASMCEVEISCVLPTRNVSNQSEPDWSYAPIVQKTSVVSAGNYDFELADDVNFAEQFNSDGYSNRRITPVRDTNGNISGYRVAKSVVATNGMSKVYKKVLTANDVYPFMEVVLPETDVLNIESIIFKETSEYTISPKTYEYYIEKEEFKVSNDAVKTHRYFECDSLADQYRFTTEVRGGTDTAGVTILSSLTSPDVYEDYTETVSGEGKTGISQRTTRYYKGKWMPLRNKFITEYTDNGYIKIIFGSGNGSLESFSGESTPFADYMASKIMNNDMLGVLPHVGWSMFVLYKVGGGVSTNLAPGSINKLTLLNVDWSDGGQGGTNRTTRNNVITSMTVTNISTAIAGKDAPSTDEVKHLIKYNTGSQNRAVTVNDYKVKLAEMPPKYGCPFRYSVAEINNKVEMCLLGLDAAGNLDPALPKMLVENIIRYMSHYKQLNDYIEVKSGKIYNIGVAVDLFVDKNYNASDVVRNVISLVKDYFDVKNRDIGEDIFIGDLEKEICLVDGVISLIDLRVYKISNGRYSPDKCPLPVYGAVEGCEPVTRQDFYVGGGGVAEEINLEECDSVLIADYNSMYEIKDETDIKIRCKMR